VLEHEGLSETAAFANEYDHGVVSLTADTLAGASRFAGGAGRHGSFENIGTTTPSAATTSPA